MHRMRILNSKETKEIRKKIEEQWGACPTLEYVFLQSPKDKIYLVTRDLERLPETKMRIDTYGLYFGEILKGGMRLSVEGAQMVGNVATKQMLEIDEAQMERWFQGKDLEVTDETLYGFLILTCKGDVLGCGMCKNKVITNYMPKNRRIKEINPTTAESNDAESGIESDLE